MSTERTRTLHQEKMILFGIGLLIVVAVATLVYQQIRADRAADTKVPDSAPLSVTLGDKSVEPAVIVYTDPICDRCAAYHEDVVLPLYEEYVESKKARLEIRPLGIVSESSASLNELLMCSNEQDKYLAASKFVYDAVHANENPTEAAAQFFNIYSAEDIATKVHVDEEKLTTCLDDNRYATKMTQADAQAYAAGIYSAPTTFIGDGEPIRGYSSYSYIKSLLALETN